MFAIMHGRRLTRFTCSYELMNVSALMQTISCVGLFTGIIAVCTVQLQVLLGDCYGTTLQLQHILANFYKLSDVFCKYHFLQCQCRTKNMQIVNK